LGGGAPLHRSRAFSPFEAAADFSDQGNPDGATLPCKREPLKKCTRFPLGGIGSWATIFSLIGMVVLSMFLIQAPAWQQWKRDYRVIAGPSVKDLGESFGRDFLFSRGFP